MSEQTPTTAPITITLLWGAGEPFVAQKKMLVRITNDSDVTTSFWADAPTVHANLQFHDGPGDHYRIVVYVDGYENGGGFVQADPKTHQTVSLLMIPSHASFDFPAWADLQEKHAPAAMLIAAGVSDSEAQARYESLAKTRPLSLASLMNLCAAMQSIELGGGKTPLSFLKEVIWDSTLAQDRFFGYADPAVIPLVRAAAADGEFAEEKDSARFHPGATLSYKQTQYDYCNVQLTFHEGDKKRIGGTECIKIEPDIDLYKDLLAHGLLEVVPNLSAHGLTNPLAVLALRWIDAVQSDEPLFNPGYTLF